jgi:hypothetical protein
MLTLLRPVAQSRKNNCGLLVKLTHARLAKVFPLSYRQQTEAQKKSRSLTLRPHGGLQLAMLHVESARLHAFASRANDKTCLLFLHRVGAESWFFRVWEAWCRAESPRTPWSADPTE